MEIVVGRRFRGPPSSGNGGYTCGLVAGVLGGRAEVTLRLPPPLDRPLRVAPAGERVDVYDGDTLVAEGRAADVELETPPPIDFDTAMEAAVRYPGFERHAFPTCFVCGPERAPGDGLRIFASPVADTELVAAPWVPAPDLGDRDGAVRPEFVWAALDCPGAFAVGFSERGEIVLGRLAVRIERLPRVGERSVVVGWRLGEDGRKLYAGTAIFSAQGERYAVGRATWIEPRLPA